MAVVVDDLLLLDVLAERAVDWIAAEFEASGLYTTSTWYYRLGRAAAQGTGTGALSGRMGSLASEQRGAVLSLLDDLPEGVGVLGPRTTVPVMVALRLRRPVNLLTAEALAVGPLTGATIAVTTDTSLLRPAAEELRIGYRVVG